MLWINIEKQRKRTPFFKFCLAKEMLAIFEIMFGGPMTAETLSGWVHDKEEREHYTEAFKRSSFSGMLNFYKANYPSPDNNSPVADAGASPRLPMPVLIFHGLKDTALHSDGLNNTWDWVDNDVTIVTAPDSGHFVQQDAAELVSQTMQWWLSNRQP